VITTTVPGDVDVDILEVVDACAAHRDPIVRHEPSAGFVVA
jgi:hypothetical protein